MKCKECGEFGGVSGCNVKKCHNTYHFRCVEKAGGVCFEPKKVSDVHPRFVLCNLHKYRIIILIV